MRIAILNCSTDSAPWALAYPNDGERFATLLRPLRPEWAYEVFQAKDGVFPDDLSVFDGIIITGSPSSVHDDLPWIVNLKALIPGIVARRQALFGACFGHQLIALSLGGAVGWNADGCCLGTAETTFHSFRPWMNPAAATIRLPSGNYEEVTALPKGADVLGSSAANAIASFAMGDHVFTTQYHPEMPMAFVRDMIVDLTAVVGPEKTAEAEAAEVLPTQCGVFAEWMVRFFEGGK